MVLQFGISGLPVVDPVGRLLGIATEGDFCASAGCRHFSPISCTSSASSFGSGKLQNKSTRWASCAAQNLANRCASF